MTFPLADFRSLRLTGKLSIADQVELEGMTPEKLDGCLWLDVVRVSKEGRRYVVRDTATNRVLSRHALIDSALLEAKRRSREQFR